MKPNYTTAWVNQKPKPPDPLRRPIAPVGYIPSEQADLQGMYFTPEEEESAALRSEARGVVCKEILALLSSVFETLEWSPAAGALAWPVALQGMQGKLDNLLNLFYMGSALVPDIAVLSSALVLEMDSVPSFLEWKYTDTRACRVLYNRLNKCFHVVHLDYTLCPVGIYYVGSNAQVLGYFTVSRESVQSAGGHLVVTAAFSPLEVDADGIVCDASKSKHKEYCLFEVCH